MSLYLIYTVAPPPCLQFQVALPVCARLDGLFRLDVEGRARKECGSGEIAQRQLQRIHAVWFIRDGFIRDAFQRLLDLLEILRDEV